MQKQTQKGKTNNSYQNNGDNGFQFENFKIKKRVADIFKANAKRLGKDYSTYLEDLLNYDYYDEILENGQFRGALNNFMNYLNRRSKEPPLKEFRW